ncbi:MAG: hypothetical protein QGI45_09205 [Myxococcota bacterium]|nr:hypothetical protein [Myxococcota bacterium]
MCLFKNICVWRKVCVLNLCLGMLSCGSAPVDTGDIRLNFSVSSSVRSSPYLDDALLGTVYGGIFHVQDVSVLGPVEGAVSLASVELEGVDLRDVEASSSFWSGTLDPGSYVFLGFFDVDGNGEESSETNPDNGDPVTLANTNAFEIDKGGSSELQVEFNLLYNFD